MSSVRAHSEFILGIYTEELISSSVRMPSCGTADFSRVAVYAHK